MNVMRTGILLAGLMALFLAVGYAIGRETGMLIALVLSLGMNAFAYWNSDRMVLAMHGARQIDRAAAPDFYDMIARLSHNAGLPMPKIYIMENPQPNAFATGRNPQNAAVAATTGSTTALTQTYHAYSLLCARDPNQRRIEVSQNSGDFSVRRRNATPALFCFTGNFC